MTCCDKKKPTIMYGCDTAPPPTPPTKKLIRNPILPEYGYRPTIIVGSCPLTGTKAGLETAIHDGAAYVTTKSLTYEPKDGDVDGHGLETISNDIAYVNRIGLENMGIVEWNGLLKNPANAGKLANRVILSIAPGSGEEAIKMLEYLFDKGSLEGYAGLEVNISCPNVKGHYTDPKDSILKRTIERYNELCRNIKPIYAKVGYKDPYAQMPEIVNLGYSGVILCNTMETERGGLSGHILFPHTVTTCSYASRLWPELDIIPAGGIGHARDIELLQAVCGAEKFEMTTEYILNHYKINHVSSESRTHTKPDRVPYVIYRY